MKEVPAKLVAEASAWLAVLHGPNRTADVEGSVSRWLKAHPDHARAFELATEAWNEPLPRDVRRSYRAITSQASPVAVGLAAAVVLAAVSAAFFYLRQLGVTTGVGEQRLIVLEDRSRVLLNTATRIVVKYGKQERHIELKSGEALFEVAPQADRPFVVMVGRRRVKALGTSFAVRRDVHQVAVTLIEGKVEVASAAPSSNGPSEARAILVSGDRLTLPDEAPLQMDRPEIDQVLAWQRREVALDNTSLPDAVAEMNRYSATPLVIEQPRLKQLRISGRFRAGDSLSFAHAIATTYSLDVVQEQDRIVLSGSF
jgi:transmembrane sensor